jgi:flagellar basal body-associated protein FliL
MRINKKGAELSFNIIIIAILVLLVLVLVGYFFTSGFAGLSNLFRGLTPDDKDVAVTSCTAKCQTAQQFSTDAQKASSSYCKTTWKLDTNGDGKADYDSENKIVKYHCYDSAINVGCADIEDKCVRAD